jgi:hypothetical protein
VGEEETCVNVFEIDNTPDHNVKLYKIPTPSSKRRNAVVVLKTEYSIC